MGSAVRHPCRLVDGALLLMVIILGCLAFSSPTQSGLLFWSVSLATAVFFTSLIYPGLIVNSIQITKNHPGQRNRFPAACHHIHDSQYTKIFSHLFAETGGNIR